jgi:hypothetical protein
MSAVVTMQQDRHSPLLSFIERAARDESFSLEKFEALLRMQREEEARQAEREFNRAMADAQGEMEPVRKAATNTHLRTKYARFEDIDAALRPVYTKHGFSVRFRTEETSVGWVKVVCVVAHAAGHIELFPLSAPLDSGGSQGKSNKTDVQAIGSTTSYLKRYLETMAFNVALAGDDDDGEGTRRQVQYKETPGHYPKRPMDPVQSMDGVLRREADAVVARRQRMTTEELDEATGGDDIPDHDSLRVDADRILGWLKRVETQDHWDKLNEKIRVTRSKLAAYPNLDTELKAAENEARARIAQSKPGDGSGDHPLATWIGNMTRQVRVASSTVAVDLLKGEVEKREHELPRDLLLAFNNAANDRDNELQAALEERGEDVT